jgi:hypothetical protein
LAPYVLITADCTLLALIDPIRVVRVHMARLSAIVPVWRSG